MYIQRVGPDRQGACGLIHLPSASVSGSHCVIRPAVLSLGGGDKCSHCNKTVYAAERVQAAGRLFHDSCLKCSTCGHGVNSTNINDKNGKLYCQPCYAKEYGPKGYGFAGGAAGLMTQ